MFKSILIFLVQVVLLNSSLIEDNSISEFADPVTVENVAFVKVGTYRGFTDDGSEYQKTYFISRYSRPPWAESRSFCKSYNLEFLSVETLTEARAYLSMLDNDSFLRSVGGAYVYIDGVGLTSKSPTDWYWSNTGKKISFSIPWRSGQPNNGGGSEYCLTVYRPSIAERFGFDDATCMGSAYVGCYRIDFLLP